MNTAALLERVQKDLPDTKFDPWQQYGERKEPPLVNSSLTSTQAL